MLFFLHIPKTAGTSVYTALKKMAPETLAWFDGPPNAPQNLLARPGIRRSVEIYGGHFSYEHILPFLTPEDKIYTVVREPIERVFSHYNHVAVRDRNHPHHEQIKNLSIVDAAKACPKFGLDIQNVQCWFISGSRNFEDALQVAMTRQIRVYMISALDLMVSDIGRDCGIKRTPTVGLANVAENDYTVNITAAEYEFVGKTNEEDLKLYSYFYDRLAQST